MGTEIKQTLERNYDLVLSAQEIRNLTFGKLTELNAGGGSGSTQSSATPAGDKKVEDEQLRFDGDEIMPKDSIVSLPSKCTNPKQTPAVFVVHAIEGTTSSLKDLASQLTAPVYGLQCTKNAPLKSLPELASFYVKLIRQTQPQGPYIIVGYSFGAGVAFEIGLQLEEQKQQVKLILLDGSPAYVGSHTQGNKNRVHGDEASEQTSALIYFIKLFTKIDDAKVYGELLSLPTYEERLQKGAAIMQTATKHSAQDLMDAAASFYYKLVITEAYKPNAKFRGNVTLLKAKENFVELSADYGLTQVSLNSPYLYNLR